MYRNKTTNIMIKHYFIRAVVNDEEPALLGDDWGFYRVDVARLARMFKGAEEAENAIVKICNEKPAKMSDGTIYPPTEIHRIGDMCITKKYARIRLSVVELDVVNLTLKEGYYIVFETSFEHPEVHLLEDGVTNKLY